MIKFFVGTLDPQKLPEINLRMLIRMKISKLQYDYI